MAELIGVLSAEQTLSGELSRWNTARSIPAGGTEGQVLAKASGTDYDVEWADGSSAVPVEYGTGTNSVVSKGGSNTASGNYSVAMGSNATASNSYAHAEGNGSTASGAASHAEGRSSASGATAHAEGDYTTASGRASHAEGTHTVANHLDQHVFGQYNTADASTASATARGNYVEIVGNGTGDAARSNARTLDWSGNEVLTGGLTVGAAGVTIGDETLTETKIADISDLKSALSYESSINIPFEFAESAKAVQWQTGEIMDGSAYSYTDYVDLSLFSEIMYKQHRSTSSSTTTRRIGMAFYNENKTYISGVQIVYGASATGYEDKTLAVPIDAKYARFSFLTTNVQYFAVSGKSKIFYHSKNIFPINYGANIKFTDGKYINASTGGASGSSYYASSEMVSVSGISRIRYPKPIANSSTAPTGGMAFYNSLGTYISGESNGYKIGSGAPETCVISVPQNATYAQFTYLKSDDVRLAQYPFFLYDADEYDGTLAADVEELQSYHPYYNGKVLSILGDSISTFCPTADKEEIDGHNYAPTGCTTTYPGNLVQYQNSDVDSVERTWWGIVLNKLGMTLGINESYAGTMISWDGSTETYKYGADKCMCSSTRIGHLGENGTPDLIIIYGGTNDINHCAEQSIPLGSLDTTDPTDFDSYPFSTTTFYGAVTSMILRIQHSYPDAVILYVLPFFVTENHANTTPYTVKQFNDVAVDVCDYLGVEYVDLRKVVNIYDMSTLLFDDLHPNATCMQLIAKSIVHKLSDML